METRDFLARYSRLTWAGLVVLLTSGWITIMATQWSSIVTICTRSCRGEQLNRVGLHDLQAHGISLTMYSALAASVLALTFLLWFGTSALIIFKRPDDPGAVLAAFFLVILPTLGPSSFLPSSGYGAVVQNAISVAAFTSLLLFGLLFPDGRFAVAWSRWLAAAGIGVFLLDFIVPSGPLANAIGGLLFAAIMLSMVAVQVQRYRGVSNWAQRQQTKWAMFGLVVSLSCYAALVVPFSFLPDSQIGNGTAYTAITDKLFPIVLSAIPISIGIAMLRNQLWDVDRVINRTLAYLLLTLALAGIYVGSVVGLQAILRAITGQQSGVAVAIATLLLAALFSPLRRRFQTVIERTFNRRHYDAARVLSRFGESCRDETNLDALREDLLGVIRETLQPAHVSVWLREQAQLEQA